MDDLNLHALPTYRDCPALDGIPWPYPGAVFIVQHGSFILGTVGFSSLCTADQRPHPLGESKKTQRGRLIQSRKKQLPLASPLVSGLSASKILPILLVAVITIRVLPLISMLPKRDLPGWLSLVLRILTMALVLGLVSVMVFFLVSKLVTELTTHMISDLGRTRLVNLLVGQSNINYNNPIIHKIC